MNKHIREMLPKWVNDVEKGKYNLVLSDDLDSLFSSIILKSMFNWEINRFYDFKSINQIQDTDKEHIYIDIATEQGKAWDNHVTCFNPMDKRNHQSANLNNVLRIDRYNYMYKYAGSTLLQIISYYRPFDLNSLTDEQKAILWAIDSSADGYYNSDFKDIHRQHIQSLELEPLLDVLDKYPRDQLYEVKHKYKLEEKIYINKNGKLETKIDLPALGGLFNLDFTLPSESFIKINDFNAYKINVSQLYHKQLCKSNPLLFSFAITKKNEVKCSSFNKKGEM